MQKELFEEYLDEMWKYVSLSAIAKEQIKDSLSEKTKKRLMRMKPEDASRVIELAVNMIDNGERRNLDTLITLNLKQ